MNYVLYALHMLVNLISTIIHFGDKETKTDECNSAPKIGFELRLLT